MQAPASTPIVRHLTSASEAEIQRITDILVDAFAGDPFTSILLGSDLSLAPHQLLADVRAAFVSKGEVHVILLPNDHGAGPDSGVEDKDAEIVGVAIWYPPGVKGFATSEEQAFREEFQALLPDSVRSWWSNSLGPASSNLTKSTLGSEYTLNAWSLHLFGVMKKHHGKGCGRMLFEYAREKAKATKSPIVVKTTTEVDVKIYTRLGFKVCGETVIESLVGNGRMYIMNIDA